MRYTTTISLLLILIPLSAALGEDRDLTSTEKSLERLERALEQDQTLAPETRESLRELVGALRAERAARAADHRDAAGEVTKGDIARAVDEYLAVRSPPEERSVWEEVLDRLALYGDLRLRYEAAFHLDNESDRHRLRLRFRLGANYQLLDDVLVGARLVTGNPEDPRSSHQTLGNAFDSFEISLDRAFVTYQPGWLDSAAVFTGGKFQHPFSSNPVYQELVWDADIQPEGAVAGYSLSDLWLLDSLDFRAGAYVLLEQGNGDDTFLFPFQVAAQFRVVENVTGNIAAGYYFYTNVDTSPLVSENRGNVTVDTDGDGRPDDYASEFGIVNPILAFTYTGGQFPVTVSGEYILNTEASIAEDQGWAVGVSAGSTRKRGDWRLYYQWQVLEQDSVFSPVTQDDFLLATNFRGHVFGGNYQILDKIGLHLWALVSQLDTRSPGASHRDEWRVRADLNVRF